MPEDTVLHGEDHSDISFGSPLKLFLLTENCSLLPLSVTSFERGFV